MGKQKPKTSVIAQMSAKAVDSLYARISNLLDSYYPKIIFSEPSLDIRTSVLFITITWGKVEANFPCNDEYYCGFAAILREKCNDVDTESRLDYRKWL